MSRGRVGVLAIRASSWQHLKSGTRSWRPVFCSLDSSWRMFVSGFCCEFFTLSVSVRPPSSFCSLDSFVHFSQCLDCVSWRNVCVWVLRCEFLRRSEMRPLRFCSLDSVPGMKSLSVAWAHAETLPGQLHSSLQVLHVDRTFSRLTVRRGNWSDALPHHTSLVPSPSPSQVKGRQVPILRLKSKS
ncbi:hypothetical protein WMY93_033522 [Mugilogobius chulae]|uniref:Uncharacterized protein n=1 Tax=Mugilogobius chulae TaxID=88201 RepID=A0AAW0MTM8_9GOBI